MSPRYLRPTSFCKGAHSVFFSAVVHFHVAVAYFRCFAAYNTSVMWTRYTVQCVFSMHRAILIHIRFCEMRWLVSSSRGTGLILELTMCVAGKAHWLFELVNGIFFNHFRFKEMNFACFIQWASIWSVLVLIGPVRCIWESFLSTGSPDWVTSNSDFPLDCSDCVQVFSTRRGFLATMKSLRRTNKTKSDKNQRWLSKALELRSLFHFSARSWYIELYWLSPSQTLP